MRPLSLSLAGLAIGVVSIVGSSASAQSPTPVDEWAAFLHGCTETAPGRDYVCACTATLAIDHCESIGHRTGDAIDRCLGSQPRSAITSFVATCESYGALALGSVPAPRPRTPARSRGETVDRISMWNSSFHGCFDDNPSSSTMAYACACIATYIVDACVPNDTTPAAHVETCATAVQPELNAAAPSCASYGSLRSRRATSTPAAVPRTTPAPAATPATDGDGDGTPDLDQARANCQGVASDAVAFAACVETVRAFVANDVPALMALVGPTARVRYGRENLPRDALETRLRNDGLRQAVLVDPSNRGVAIGFTVTRARGRLVLANFADDGESVAEVTLRAARNAPYQLASITYRTRRASERE